MEKELAPFYFSPRGKAQRGGEDSRGRGLGDQDADGADTENVIAQIRKGLLPTG